MKIIIKNLQKKISVSPKRIKQAIFRTLSAKSSKRAGRITVCIAGEKKIRELNKRYLKKNEATDVLAFQGSGPGRASDISADIIVSTDAAVRNAGIFKTSPLYETQLYVIHGVLHILGYRDKSAKERKLMQRKAEQILSSLDPEP